MATCPRCGEFLNDHHRCVGVWRLRLRVLRAIFAGASIGAVVAWIIGSIAFSGPSGLFLFIAALIGATVAAGWLRGEPPL